MYTIIVSSVNPTQNALFKTNVSQTIATPYELIVHDNRETKWGLCKLYNHYARQSKYDLLCFFHEDILFLTKGWGLTLAEFFRKTPDAGVVGFAGATLKTKTVSGWDSHRITARMNVTHRINENKVRKRVVNPNNESFAQVLTVDGLAMITPKHVWEKYPFDEQTFTGFHLYDLDFSFQIAQEYKNYVCLSIDIEHLSRGAFAKEWCQAASLFHEKWKDQLPYAIYPYPDNIIEKCETAALYRKTRSELMFAWDIRKIRAIIWEHIRLSYNKTDGFYYMPKLIRHMIKAYKKKLFR